MGSSAAVRSGDLGSAAAAAHHVLARATRIGYHPYVCWARIQLGVTADRAGRPSDARADFEAALELARDLELPHYVSFVQSLLGGAALRTGDTTAARHAYTEALQTANDADAPWFAALARVGLAAAVEADDAITDADALRAAVVAWGDAAARGPARESFFITMSGDPYAVALIALGARQLEGHVEPGADLLRRGVDEAVLEQDPAAIAFALERVAAAIAATGDTARVEDAIALLAAATALRTATAHPRTALERRTVDVVMEGARSAVAPGRLAAAEERGRAVAPEDAPDLLRHVVA
jgi:tetratricopeptide (TPR) repeat protein